MASKQDLYVPLVEEFTLEQPRRPRVVVANGAAGTSLSLAKLLLLIAGVVSLTVALFIGGFYLGKSETPSNTCPSSTPVTTPTYVSSAFAGSLAGQSASAVSIQGTEPASVFVQCHLLSTPSGSICSPSNPLLSQQSTIQITFFQHEDTVNWIFTASGSKFGSPSAANVQEVSFTLHVSGINAAVMRLGDPFSQDFARQDLSASQEFTMDFSLMDSSSQGVVFTWVSLSSTQPAVVYISNVVGLAPAHFDLMGTYAANFEVLPTATAPLTLRAANTVSFAPSTFAAAQETTVATSNTVTLNRATSFRRRRDLGTGERHLLSSVEIKDPNTGVRQLRVEFFVNNRTGGDNAGLCMNLTDFTLHKQAMLDIYQNQYIQQFGNVSSNFVSTLLINDDTTKPVPTNNTIVQWYSGSFPKKYLAGATDLPLWAKQALQRIKTEVTALQSAQHERKRRFNWGCAWDIGKTAIDGAECGLDIYDADVWGAVDDCISTGEDAYDAYHRC